MKSEETQVPLPAEGALITTACKGTIRYEKNVPTLVYKGRRLYFCLPTCKRSFEYDPKTSCLAGDPLLDS
jgi:YHS domain-containing protein